MAKPKPPSRPSPKSAPASKRPEGKPPFVPTQAQRELVQAMSAYGIPQDDIRLLIINSQTKKPLSRDTLAKAFEEEIATGTAKANAQVIGALFKNAVGGNVTAQIYWTKCRAGWREKVEVGMPALPEGAAATPEEARKTLGSWAASHLRRTVRSRRRCRSARRRTATTSTSRNAPSTRPMTAPKWPRRVKRCRTAVTRSRMAKIWLPRFMQSAAATHLTTGSVSTSSPARKRSACRTRSRTTGTPTVHSRR